MPHRLAHVVLADPSPDYRTGQRAVDDVSRRVASLLTGCGALQPRTVDRPVCVQASAGKSWAQLAARLRLSASRAT